MNKRFIMKNKVQLITYVDRFAGSTVTALHEQLQQEFPDVFAGVHLLPFYYPIDGSDAGFDPIDHSVVDARLGTWQDVKGLGQDYELMADLIVNHMSAQSVEFQDVLAQGKDSEFWSLFIKKEDIFPNGMDQQQADLIYRPRPGSCFSEYQLSNGEAVDFWTTFTSNQVDINVETPAGEKYLAKILTQFSDANIKMIRLDAAGYAIKRAGTSCFMLDQTFDFINKLSSQANELGITSLVEIHSYYKTQIEIAKRVDLVYDFALPPLVLHTLFSKNADALVNWLTISPRNCITVLDTHDGIGIIDAGPMGDKPGLLNAYQIDNLVNQIHANTGGESLKATGAAASNVDLYQVNSSYYGALGYDDYLYLVARALQFFSPGIPQVYYGGLLAEVNDMELLASSNVGRDINRPYLKPEQVTGRKQKPVVQALLRLIKLRNEVEAFNGEFALSHADKVLKLNWIKEANQAQLCLDLNSLSCSITITNHDEVTVHDLKAWL